MKRKALAHIFSLICVFVWGTTFLSTKVLLRDFSPAVIIMYRLIICLLILFIISPKIYKLEKAKHELLYLGAGASGICFYFLFENFALKYTSTSNVGIIVSMAPMFTMLFSSIILRNTKIKWNFILGFFIAIAGVVLVSYNGNKSFGLSPKGDILAILAMVCWGFYSVFVYKISNLGYKGVGSTRKIMYYGLICLIPFIFIMKSRFNIDALKNYKNILNFIYLGFCASTLAFMFWNYSVYEIGPVKTSIYLYIQPAICVVASVLILHDDINVLSVIGMILSVIGLFISGDLLFKKRSINVEENIKK